MKYHVSLYHEDTVVEQNVWVWLSNHCKFSTYHVSMWLLSDTDKVGWTRKYSFKFKRDAVLFRLTFS